MWVKLSFKFQLMLDVKPMELRKLRYLPNMLRSAINKFVGVVIDIVYVQEMDRQFQKWMDFYGKSYGDYELFKGDFLDPQFDEIINSAT